MHRFRPWFALSLLALVPAPARADYALRDGDTVVFLGDSITAARTYGKIVENYTLLRFPGRKVRFFNAGWGGDTAAGGLKRLDRDVFSHNPTVLIVAYGVNDIGWGLKADAEHKKIYLDSIKGIIERCKERKVRVFIASAAITAENPDTAEKGFLQSMCDEGMALSRLLGEGSIDIAREMRAIQRNMLAWNAQSKDEKDNKHTLHVIDGVHLNDLGQLAMALAILKGLGAPAEVSSVVVDAAGPSVIEAKGCAVTKLSGDAKGLEFDRLDEGLPINFGVFGALQFRFIPVSDTVNRYMLTVKGLAPGKYDLVVDGRGVGTFAGDQFAKGVNIASSTADGWEPGGPWDAQAALLIKLTDARDNIAQAHRLTRHYLPDFSRNDESSRQSDEAIARIEAQQRTIAKPATYHFVIRPAAPKKP